MTEGEDIWFPAKTYGWGWGLPVKWQGWAVLAAYTVLFTAGFVIFPPFEDESYFMTWQVLLTGGLIAVCRLKGEEPRWRWGEK